MTDRATAIRALIKKVKDGECPMQTEFTGVVGLNPDNRHLNAFEAFHGSLDAAQALHEAVIKPLPSNGNTGWSVELSISFDGDLVGGPEYFCDIYDGNYYYSCQTSVEVKSKHSLASAWLLAILQLLLEQEET